MARFASPLAWQQPLLKGLMDDSPEAREEGGFVSHVGQVGCSIDEGRGDVQHVLGWAWEC